MLRGVLLGLLAATLAASSSAALETFAGMAEASAAAMLDGRHFIVADDECNVLRIYRSGEQLSVAPPVDLRDFLRAGEKASDLEAAARVGDTIYWISSHSRTSSGERHEGRQRLFATRIETGISAAPPTVTPIGQPYMHLLRDLIDAPALNGLKLKKAAERKPEAKNGLNIEGLAATPEGGLLVGFRNPLRDGKAVIVPLKNPAEVMNGAKPDFSKPILLDLGERGVRSMARFGDEYVILAGPVANHGRFALYRWSGRQADSPRLHSLIQPGIHAEAVLVLDSGGLMLLSDDGAGQPEADCGGPGKEAQKFRAVRVQVN